MPWSCGGIGYHFAASPATIRACSTGVSIPAQAEPPTNSRGVVQRTAVVLDAFTVNPQWGVRELAAHLQLPRSGVHRVLQEMAAEGLLRTDDGGTYSIGAKLLHLCSGLLRSADLSRVAHAHLVAARDAVKETTILIAYEPTRQQIIAIDSVETMLPVKFPWAALRDWTDLHLSASGRALLTFLPTAELDRYVARIAGDSPQSAIDRRALDKELREIRARGWAISHGERVPGTSGVGAPIFNAQSALVGGVVIAWPDRFPANDDEHIGSICLQTARAISQDLGWIPG